MASKQDSDEIFEMAANDPSIWREQAGWLKTAAQLHLDRIGIIAQESTLSPAGRSDALMPHFQGYMMLTSFAFENLIKAIIVSRNPGMAIKISKLNTIKLNTSLWAGKNGHELADIMPGDIPLDSQEKDLLTRLQAFAIWAGRYPTTVSSDDFHAAQGGLTFKSTDPALAGNLFLRLTTFVVNSD